MTIQSLLSIAVNLLAAIIVGGVIIMMYSHPPRRVDSRIVRNYIIRKRYELLRASLVFVFLSVAFRVIITIYSSVAGSGPCSFSRRQ